MNDNFIAKPALAEPKLVVAKERRRPGRVNYTQPALIELLRGLPFPIPRVTPTRARDIARSLKSLADEYTGMRHEANCMMRGSEWWLAYAMTLEHTRDAKE